MEIVQEFTQERNKLQSEKFLNLLICELYGEIPDEVTTAEEKAAFINHFPLDLNKFYSDMLNIIRSNSYCAEDFQNLTRPLTSYIVAIVYFLTNPNEYLLPELSGKILIGKFYMELLCLPVGHLFFVPRAFNNILNLLWNSSVSRYVNSTELFDLIVRYSNDNSLSITASAVRSVATAIARIILETSSKIINDFDKETGDNIHYLKSYKLLICNNDNSAFVELFFEKLLMLTQTHKCMNNLRPEHFRHAQINVRSYLTQHIYPDLKVEKRKILTKSLINMLSYQDMNSPEQIALIIKSLDLNEYKDVVMTLSDFLKSENHEDVLENLILLLVNLLKIETPEKDIGKTEVIYRCAVRSVVLLTKHPKYGEFAIQSFAEICILYKSNKLLRNIISSLANRIDTDLSYDLILSGFFNLPDKKSKHVCKNLLKIITILLIKTRNTHMESETSSLLYKLCWTQEPANLINMLPFLHICFIKMCTRNFSQIALTILRILVRMALARDKQSEGFTKFLYNQCIVPSASTGPSDIEYSRNYYSSYLIDNRFEYEKLFDKAKQLSYIRQSHLNFLLNAECHNFDGDLKCVSMLLNYTTEAVDTEKFLKFALTITKELLYSTHALHFFESIVRLFETKRLNFNVDCEMINCLKFYFILSDSIRMQTLHVFCFQNAIKVCKELEMVLTMSSLLMEIKDEYYILLEEALETFSSVIPILYALEFMLASGEEPPDRIKDKLFKLITDPNERTKLTNERLYLYIPLVTYYASIAYVSKDHVTVANHCLREALCCSDETIRIGTIKILLSLAEKITFDYSYIIEYIFNDLQKPILDGIIKAHITILEDLIHSKRLQLDFNQFLLFTYPAGMPECNQFMMYVIRTRFVTNEPNLIAKYFVQAMMCFNKVFRLNKFLASKSTKNIIKGILINVINLNDIFDFLYNDLNFNVKLAILKEIGFFLNYFINNPPAIESNEINFLRDCISTFSKTVKQNQLLTIHHINDVLNFIATKILVRNKTSPQKPEHKVIHEDEIKSLTDTLIGFFKITVNNVNSLKRDMFECIILWTWFFRADIQHIVQHDRDTNMSRCFSCFSETVKNDKNILLIYE